MNFKREQQNIVSDLDGLALSLLVLVPECDIKGIVQMHHGMAEHKERYLPFMEYLASEGYVAAIHDCRGHGESVKCKDDLGYMYRAGANGLVEDTYQITLFLKERWPNVPLILFGHSMGSLVVRTYTKKYDENLDLLIVCGSPSKNKLASVAKNIACVQERMFGDHYRSEMLYHASFDSYKKAFPKESSARCWLCSDEQVVAQYEASELCGFHFTVDGYRALFELMEQTYSKKDWKVKNPQLPILFLGGAKDPCVGGARKYAQAVQFLRLMGYKKTKGRLYPEMRHEVLNEKNNQMVFEEVKKYMEKHLKCR